MTSVEMMISNIQNLLIEFFNCEPQVLSNLFPDGIGNMDSVKSHLEKIKADQSLILKNNSEKF